MFTRDERRALLFLGAVTVAGGVIRVTRPDGPSATPATGAAAVAPGLVGEDLVRQAARSRRAELLSRPLAPGERVDVDHAAADELERLPRVGPRLAQRIVAEREANGRFGSLAGLRRVPGMSPGLLRALERYVTFGGVPPAVTASLSAFPRPGAPAAVSPGSSAPPAPESAAAGRRAGAACAGPVSLNRATREELMCLPGIGPVLAARIVADRNARGAFRDVADLARVPGIGQRRVERLRGRVTIP